MKKIQNMFTLKIAKILFFCFKFKSILTKSFILFFLLVLGVGNSFVYASNPSCSLVNDILPADQDQIRFQAFIDKASFVFDEYNVPYCYSSSDHINLKPEEDFYVHVLLESVNANPGVFRRHLEDNYGNQAIFTVSGLDCSTSNFFYTDLNFPSLTGYAGKYAYVSMKCRINNETYNEEEKNVDISISNSTTVHLSYTVNGPRIVAACGSAASSVAVDTVPTTNLCSYGTATPVLIKEAQNSNGKFSWACVGNDVKVKEYTPESSAYLNSYYTSSGDLYDKTGRSLCSWGFDDIERINCLTNPNVTICEVPKSYPSCIPYQAGATWCSGDGVVADTPWERNGVTDCTDPANINKKCKFTCPSSWKLSDDKHYCVEPTTSTPPTCGTPTPTCTAPSTGLCTSGTPTAVLTENGKFTWACLASGCSIVQESNNNTGAIFESLYYNGESKCNWLLGDLTAKSACLNALAHINNVKSCEVAKSCAPPTCGTLPAGNSWCADDDKNVTTADANKIYPVGTVASCTSDRKCEYYPSTCGTLPAGNSWCADDDKNVTTADKDKIYPVGTVTGCTSGRKCEYYPATCGTLPTGNTWCADDDKNVTTADKDKIYPVGTVAGCTSDRKCEYYPATCGTLPAGSAWCAGDDANVTDADKDKDKAYNVNTIAGCTNANNRKCEYYTGSKCANLPAIAGATWCTGDDTNVGSADNNQAYNVNNALGCSNLKKCEYYTSNFTCGDLPVNSSWCSGDGLGGDSANELHGVSSCTATKCEYTCNTDYILDTNKNCVYYKAPTCGVAGSGINTYCNSPNSADLCKEGTASAPANSGASWTWTCTGMNNTTVNCSATKKCDPPPPNGTSAWYGSHAVSYNVTQGADCSPNSNSWEYTPYNYLTQEGDGGAWRTYAVCKSDQSTESTDGVTGKPNTLNSFVRPSSLGGRSANMDCYYEDRSPPKLEITSTTIGASTNTTTNGQKLDVNLTWTASDPFNEAGLWKFELCASSNTAGGSCDEYSKIDISPTTNTYTINISDDGVNSSDRGRNDWNKYHYIKITAFDNSLVYNSSSMVNYGNPTYRFTQVRFIDKTPPVIKANSFKHVSGQVNGNYYKMQTGASPATVPIAGSVFAPDNKYFTTPIPTNSLAHTFTWDFEDKVGAGDTGISGLDHYELQYREGSLHGNQCTFSGPWIDLANDIAETASYTTTTGNLTLNSNTSPLYCVSNPALCNDSTINSPINNCVSNGCEVNTCQGQTCNNECRFDAPGIKTDGTCCTDKNWSPLIANVCEGTTFTQTSNCNNVRSSTGIKKDGTCCKPNCTGKTCGDNGCGGSCGTCTNGTCSTTGVCTSNCSCGTKICGDNGCGGSCGTCDSGYTCSTLFPGECVSSSSSSSSTASSGTCSLIPQPGSKSYNFSINSSNTVKDNITGLIWEKSSSTFDTWDNAITYCNNLILDGYTDWHLPSSTELVSMAYWNPTGFHVDLNYFTCGGSVHWTNTNIGSDQVTVVDFYTGCIDTASSSSIYKANIRCVR